MQAQTNMTNTTSTSGQNQTAQGVQNQTMSKETQALMTLDIGMIKEKLMNAKQAIVNGNTEEAFNFYKSIFVHNSMLSIQMNILIPGFYATRFMFIT